MYFCTPEVCIFRSAHRYKKVKRPTRRITQNDKRRCLQGQWNGVRAPAPVGTVIQVNSRGGGYRTTLTATTWPSVQEMSTPVKVNDVLDLPTWKGRETSSRCSVDPAASGKESIRSR